jgi:hypothetical protein
MTASPPRRTETEAEDDLAQVPAVGRTYLDELLGRDLKGLDLIAIFISEIEIAEKPIVIAVGVDTKGRKCSLGIYEGGTSDPADCQAAVADLVARGLERHVRRLFVTDGGPAIGKALRAVFGRRSLIQECRIRKRREILSRLPESEHSRIRRNLHAAWSEIDAPSAKTRLQDLAEQLRAADLGGSRTLLERIDETLTVSRLRLPPRLQSMFSTTSEAEWGILSAASSTSWPAEVSVLEWAAATLLNADRCARPIRGHRLLRYLAAQLGRGSKSPGTVESLPVPTPAVDQPALFASIRLPAAGTPSRLRSRRLGLWLMRAAIQLSYLLIGLSVVFLFAEHRLTAAVTLAVGMWVGVVLGILRQQVPIAGWPWLLAGVGVGLLAGIGGGILAISWQLSPSYRLSWVTPAELQRSLHLWVPAIVGVALGLTNEATNQPIARRLNRQLVRAGPIDVQGRGTNA